jgi:DNA-binding transcriptional LysR family regulator
VGPVTRLPDGGDGICGRPFADCEDAGIGPAQPDESRCNLWPDIEVGEGRRQADPPGAPRIGEEAVMADAMEAAGQDMGKKAADELVRRQRHGLLAITAFDAIILVSEGHAASVMRDEPAVRDREKPLRDGEELVQILPEWSEERFPLYAYHPSGHLPSAKVRAFLDFVLAIMPVSTA